MANPSFYSRLIDSVDDRSTMMVSDEVDPSIESPMYDPSGEIRREARMAAAFDSGATRHDKTNERKLSEADMDVVASINAVLSSMTRTRTSAGMQPFDKTEIRAKIAELVDQQVAHFGVSNEEMIAAILDEYQGLFGLEVWLNNPLVSDILINAYDDIIVEMNGQMMKVPTIFEPGREHEEDNKNRMAALIERMVSHLAHHGEPTIEDPIVDTRFDYELDDGSVANVRINVVLHTLSSKRQSAISLRKPVASGFDHLSRWYQDELALTSQAAIFLETAFRNRANILLVGGTGSGKTSLMKGLIEVIPGNERIIMAEEANEIVLDRPNQVSLVSNDRTPIADLIRAGMRMRPDRIIVGECRASTEVMAFLDAVNTGHSGSITTTHASSASDGLQRLLSLATSGSNVTGEHLAHLILSGIDLVVFLGSPYVRQADGTSRRVRKVMEIVTLDDIDAEQARLGRVQFTPSPVFGRFIDLDHPKTGTDIGMPLGCRGPDSLSARFQARMRSQGWAGDDLYDLVRSSSELMRQNWG
jgi:pilus assembly protein CpaF